MWQNNYNYPDKKYFIFIFNWMSSKHSESKKTKPKPSKQTSKQKQSQQTADQKAIKRMYPWKILIRMPDIGLGKHVVY